MTPRNVTCALCGHGPLKMITECGYRRDEDGQFLCHCDDHDCYAFWARGARTYATQDEADDG